MNGNSNVSDPDASLGMNGSDQQIEATLCSSRIEDDDRGAMVIFFRIFWLIVFF